MLKYGETNFERHSGVATQAVDCSMSADNVLIDRPGL